MARILPVASFFLTWCASKNHADFLLTRTGDTDRGRGHPMRRGVSASPARVGCPHQWRQPTDFGLRPTPPNHHHPHSQLTLGTPLGRGCVGVGGLYARLLIWSCLSPLRGSSGCALGASPHPLRAWATPFPARCRLPEGTPSLRSRVVAAAAATASTCCASFAPQSKLASLILIAFLLSQKVGKEVAHALRAGDLRG